MVRAGWMGASVFLAACGSYQTRVVALQSYPGPTEQNGVVCVVRAADPSLGLREPVPVWDNGVLVGATHDGSHFCYLAERGDHVITSELLVTAEFRIRVEANARHGIKQDVGRSAYRPWRPWVMLSLASNAQTDEALAWTDRLALIEAPPGERIPSGGAVPAADLED